jgi:hypothetical protein
MEDQQSQGQNFGQPPFTGAPVPQPKNWLVESILVTLFCCLPFGIAGIVNAANVNSKYAGGDYAGAEAASKAAGKYTKIGFYCGIALIILYVIFFVVMGLGAGLMSH